MFAYPLGVSLNAALRFNYPRSGGFSKSFESKIGQRICAGMRLNSYLEDFTSISLKKSTRVNT